MAKEIKILILCLIILLGIALLRHVASFRSESASARQHEEAVKRAQLEADLIKAVKEGNGQTTSPGKPSRKNSVSTSKPGPT